MTRKREIAELLESDSPPDPDLAERLAPLLYDELRARARAYLRGERSNHSLQPTALVHEAYMRLAGSARIDWRGRTHFLAAAAVAMRHVLVDYARGRNSTKRGGSVEKVSIDDVDASVEPVTVDLIALHDALEKLASLNPRHARIVELRFFAGMTVPEVAECLGLSQTTVEDDWTFARAWLRRELGRSGCYSPDSRL
jgi:RNA polymerase sigma-70 factor, ECF subfamily